ncbi:MAG TPA: Rrf2 family transcriptional regulator [Minicystis sp.]|nr:Rrf2 family transcriptional regulator [Minicystis sp.]
MNRDSRLSVALHVLLHLEEMDGPATSQALGAMMDTNPVVIRRTLAGLRDARIVVADKGHGGGWTLAVDLRTITVADVYDSLGPTRVFGIGVHEDAPRCPLEREVNRAVHDALDRAEAELRQSFRSMNVAALLKAAKKRSDHEHARRDHRRG